MNRRFVQPIVEGDGDVAAIDSLLTRIWRELLIHPAPLITLRAIRQSRGALVAADQRLRDAVELAARKLNQKATAPEQRLILLMVDADDDCPAEVATTMIKNAKAQRGDQRIACVIPNPEFETWFIAAAESLINAGELELGSNDTIPVDPDNTRAGKRWIAQRITWSKYSEPVDQPRLTRRMDLLECRARSRSFDKLCRELEAFAAFGDAAESS